MQNSVRSGIAEDQMLCALVLIVGRNQVPTARQWGICALYPPNGEAPGMPVYAGYLARPVS